jgi:hypothetical protein
MTISIRKYLFFHFLFNSWIAFGFLLTPAILPRCTSRTTRCKWREGQTGVQLDAIFQSRNNNAEPNDPTSRRSALVKGLTSAIAILPILLTQSTTHGNARAVDNDPEEEVTFMDGDIFLDSEDFTPLFAKIKDAISNNRNGVLYITAQPESLRHTPLELRQKARGPVVLAARIPLQSISQLPFHFTLTTQHLTREGVDGAVLKWNETEEEITYEVPPGDPSSIQEVTLYTKRQREELVPSKLWWKDDNLIVRAQFECDGVRMTRYGVGLVGWSYFNQRDGIQHVDIELNRLGYGTVEKQI